MSKDFTDYCIVQVVALKIKAGAKLYKYDIDDDMYDKDGTPLFELLQEYKEEVTESSPMKNIIRRSPPDFIADTEILAFSLSHSCGLTRDPVHSSSVDYDFEEGLKSGIISDNYDELVKIFTPLFASYPDQKDFDTHGFLVIQLPTLWTYSGWYNNYDGEYDSSIELVGEIDVNKLPLALGQNKFPVKI